MGPRSNDRGNSSVWRAAGGSRIASMGPRSNDRGNEIWKKSVVPAWKLQWGRDQMIAEICKPLSALHSVFPLQWGRDQMIAEISRRIRHLVISAELQWGRDQMIAEICWVASAIPASPIASMGPRSNDRGNEINSDSDQDLFSASMGPRSNDRGNELDAIDWCLAHTASMGPRSNDRGNPAGEDISRRNFLLQWGRDQMIAEMIGDFGRIARGVLLQWGRDQMIAEMPPEPGVFYVPAGLQWGRDQMIAEMIKHAVGKSLCFYASMGPRSNDRGNIRRREP